MGISLVTPHTARYFDDESVGRACMKGQKSRLVSSWVRKAMVRQRSPSRTAPRPKNPFKPAPSVFLLAVMVFSPAVEC